MIVMQVAAGHKRKLRVRWPATALLILAALTILVKKITIKLASFFGQS